MKNYIALLRKDKNSDYGVDFPDFPGCVTAGKTMDEAREMAKEALEFHIQGMIEEGYEIPESSAPEQIMEESENKDAVAFLVSVPIHKDITRRINVTIPESVLRKIDEYVKTHPGQNRSRLLTQGFHILMDKDSPKRSFKTAGKITKKPKRKSRQKTG